MTPAKASEEEAGPDTGVRNTPSVPPAPQPIGRPPNTGGEAEIGRRKPRADQRPPAPPEPPPTPPPVAARSSPPRLPAPSNGRHFCSFREIKAWGAHYGIAYNGSNIAAVNNRRKLMGLLPVVQDEDRTAADTGRGA